MDLILKNTFQKISPAYELIADVTVASNTTQVDITGLNIGKDDELLLVGDCVNSTGSNSDYRLFVNGNTTVTNYYRQVLKADGATLSSNRYNDTSVAVVSATLRSFSATKIKLTNSGYFVNQSGVLVSYPTSVLLSFNKYNTSTFTATSITSLRISANITNAIGTGSRFQLYKLVAEKVADIIVPTNTTSVDITGLNIGKDGEYYLVSDVWNPTSSGINYALFANGNTTQTNYWKQYLYAEGTTVGTGSLGRYNGPSILSVGEINRKTISFADLKLTNSGYYVVQAENIRDYSSGSLMFLQKNYATSTFVTSAITQLTITADVTNAIGANSRFTLYKMK